jgi:hypothetical protein
MPDSETPSSEPSPASADVPTNDSTYRPLADVDESFPLVAEPTLRVLRELRRLQVRAECLPAEKRAYVCKTMAWDPEEAIPDPLSEEALGEDAFYVELGKILFGGAFAKAAEADDSQVNFQEILRAKKAFL